MSSKKKRKSQKRYYANSSIGKVFPMVIWENPKFNLQGLFQKGRYIAGIDPIPVDSEEHSEMVKLLPSTDEKVWMAEYKKQSDAPYFKLTQEEVRKKIEEIFNKNKTE